MDDKLPNEVGQDDETSDNAERSGPLGRLLEHSAGPSMAGPDGGGAMVNNQSQPITASDYAEGTREHDDDREE